ncbi:MAG: 5-(carboxyamino)imidazole ribonucleotide synthase [Pseudomonadota bacterium]
MIEKGATLGILGGGQLGMMFTQAAQRMGYKVIVLDPNHDSPTGKIADEHLQSMYTDINATDYLIDACSAVSTEFENIPLETLRLLEKKIFVCPSSDCLRVAQSRTLEKDLSKKINFSTTAYIGIENKEKLLSDFKRIQTPAYLKINGLGYDGKGQKIVKTINEAIESFMAFGEVPCILEEAVKINTEISIILARNINGDIATFPAAENIHRNGILHMSIVPARVPAHHIENAKKIAQKIANTLDYIGILAVEFFITEANDLLVNEIAPRPHNSGHYTIEACSQSQFDLQVKTMCDIPLGDISLGSPAVMVNLLGDLWSSGTPNLAHIEKHKSTELHLYNKSEPRPGRKMAHFTTLDKSIDVAKDTAIKLFEEI